MITNMPIQSSTIMLQTTGCCFIDVRSSLSSMKYTVQEPFYRLKCFIEMAPRSFVHVLKTFMTRFIGLNMNYLKHQLRQKRYFNPIRPLDLISFHVLSFQKRWHYSGHHPIVWHCSLCINIDRSQGSGPESSGHSLWWHSKVDSPFLYCTLPTINICTSRVREGIRDIIIYSLSIMKLLCIQ